MNSSDQLITDSGASGTAFATGHKTYNTSMESSILIANILCAQIGGRILKV